jgi:hypothetical protein
VGQGVLAQPFSGRDALRDLVLLLNVVRLESSRSRRLVGFFVAHIHCRPGTDVQGKGGGRHRRAGLGKCCTWTGFWTESGPRPDASRAASLRRRPRAGWRGGAYRYRLRPVQPTNGQNGTPPRRRTRRTAGPTCGPKHRSRRSPFEFLPAPRPLRELAAGGTVRFTSPRPNHVPVPTRFERAMRRVGHSYVRPRFPGSPAPAGPAVGFLRKRYHQLGWRLRIGMYRNISHTVPSENTCEDSR